MVLDVQMIIFAFFLLNLISLLEFSLIVSLCFLLVKLFPRPIIKAQNSPPRLPNGVLCWLLLWN